MGQPPVTAQILIDYLNKFPPDSPVCVRDAYGSGGVLDVVRVAQGIQGVILIVDSNGL